MIIRLAALALFICSAPALAQAPAADPATEAQLLKQQLELLKQRLDALEAQNAAATKAAAEAQAAAAKAAAEAQAAAAKAAADAQAAAEAVAEPPPAPYVEPWLVAENWQRIFRGSDESIIKGLLGRPESTQLGPAGNVWFYQDPEQPQLGKGIVRFMKGRGAIDWEAPASAR